MNDILETIESWSRSGERVAIATVVETKKSAPQPVGTKMAINDAGAVAGAVSGGCVEGAVVEVAERVIDGAEPQLLHYGIADEEAWDVGLPCGGEIAVWVEAFDTAGLQSRFTELARGGSRVAVVTVVEGDAPLGAKLLLTADGPDGTLGDPELDAEALALGREALWSELGGLHQVRGATVFVDVAAPSPRLVIVGAVDFAAQLAAVAALAGWRAFVVDPRARFATAERFPAAERVLVAWPQEAFAQLEPFDPATAIAVLTHDPKLDDAALTFALGSDARLHRCDGQPPGAGQAAGAAARCGREAAAARARRRPDRPRHRRAQCRRDRPLDHERDHRTASRPQWRKADRGTGEDPRRGQRLIAHPHPPSEPMHVEACLMFLIGVGWAPTAWGEDWLTFGLRG